MAYMLAVYSGYGHYEKAESLLQHLSQIPENERPHNYELCLAKYHEGLNRTDSAIVHYIIYYNKATGLTGRYEAAAGLQRCHFRKGDYRQAALWGQHLDETNDSIIAQRAFEYEGSDPAEVHRIGQKIEHQLYIETIAKLLK